MCVLSSLSDLFKGMYLYLQNKKHIKKIDMEKMTKEELLKAIKKAKVHKEQALKQTAK